MAQNLQTYLHEALKRLEQLEHQKQNERVEKEKTEAIQFLKELIKEQVINESTSHTTREIR